MDWPLLLFFVLGGLILLLCMGVPVAFAFTLVNILGAFLFWGGEVGLGQLILSIYDSVTKFTLLPIVMFIMMGEVMFHSGIGIRMIDALDKWIGRLPGRLGLMAVVAGALFSTMSGSSIGTTGMLGTVLVPEMEKKGYQKPMSVGPILGSGGLAIMIPPSGFGVILAVLANISLGDLLIGILIPGLTMALLYSGYIVIRCWLQPFLAPAYDLPPIPLSQKITLSLKYVLPLGSIIFLVLGLIFLGVATPSESAALGALGTFSLAAVYRRLNWDVIKKSVSGTVKISAMVLMIVTGSTAYSQIFAFTGISKGLVQFVLEFSPSPILVVVSMLFVTSILGTFMEVVSIMMITIPIFMPIINALGFDPVWFGAIILLTFEMAQTTPPFGVLLFVMKGVAPSDTTVGDCIRAAVPFLLLDLVVIVLMMMFPQITLWLPNIMR